MPKDTEPRKKEEFEQELASDDCSSDGALDVPDEICNEYSIDFKVRNPG